jgi:alpha-L-fucosidase
MGMSFGYNRIENIDDYRTEQELIYMLVYLVSRGGNLLLNIGPTADGRIPVIMQQRLLQLGDWLEVNGEAIYGTRTWKTSAQWSEGRIPQFTTSDYHTGFPIYEMTIAPKKGNAVKEFYFTRKESTLYAFAPRWPSKGQVQIKNVKVGPHSKVSLLGCDKEIPHKVRDGGIELDLTSIGINDVAIHHMHAFKITGVGQ